MERLKKILTLPLPPSINKYMIWAPRMKRFIHSSEAREYLETIPLLVKQFCKKNKIEPIEEYTKIYLDFYLSRSNSDSHNYKKIIFDVLQKGEMFKDDRFILDSTEKVEIDRENPRVDVYFSV